MNWDGRGRDPECMGRPREREPDHDLLRAHPVHRVGETAGGAQTWESGRTCAVRPHRGERQKHAPRAPVRIDADDQIRPEVGSQPGWNHLGGRVGGALCPYGRLQRTDMP